MAHTNVQLVSGNLTTGGEDPTFFIDQVNNKVGIGDVPDTSGDDSSNVLQVNGSVLATKYHGDGSSLTGIENSQWLHNISDSTKIYYNGGNVGIGEDNPGSKLVVNGDIDIKNGNLKTNGTDAIFSNWVTDTNGINRAGNVGIGGVASATNALKVHGTVEATSFTSSGTSTFGSDGLLHINSRSSQHGSETVGLQTTIDGRALTEADPGTYGGESRNVLALQPDGGFVGIGTTSPRDPLTVRPAATTDEGIHSGICIDHETGHANAKRGLTWHNTNNDFEMGAIRMEVGGNYNSCKMSFFTSASKATAIERMTLDHSGNLVATGDVTASSDRRLKTDIKRIEGALNKVRTLGGYTFTKNDNPSTGLIAQEVLEVLPEAVHGTEETYYSIAYGNMVGILIEAIKELSDEVKELKEKIG